MSVLKDIAGTILEGSAAFVDITFVCTGCDYEQESHNNRVAYKDSWLKGKPLAVGSTWTSRACNCGASVFEITKVVPSEDQNDWHT